MIFLKLELEKEIAYIYFLKISKDAINRYLYKAYKSIGNLTIEDKVNKKIDL